MSRVATRARALRAICFELVKERRKKEDVCERRPSSWRKLPPYDPCDGPRRAQDRGRFRFADLDCRRENFLKFNGLALAQYHGWGDGNQRKGMAIV
jgi:hypothetical protein